MIFKKFAPLLIIVVTVLASSFAFYFYQVLFTANILVEKEDTLFAISEGSTFKDVQNSLYNQGYVNDLISFSFLAKLKSYDENVKPGMYLLKKDMSNMAAVNLLRSGAQTSVKVTFTHFRKIDELPSKVAAFFSFSENELEAYVKRDSTAYQYGFTPETFISMFIPNTYDMYWTYSPEKFLDRMKVEYDKFWNEKRLSKAQAIGLTPQEVSTLASIVESETKKPDEAPVVAGVYMNRLKRGIALQADPTLVFAKDDFTIRRVLNADKKIDSPYNTYKYTGLPPGPISLPSIAAIESVLNHQEHRYLYFCAREDFSGYHVFAKTLKEHNRNAERFQRALNKEKIYR